MKNAVYQKVLAIVVIICLIFVAASLMFKPNKENQRINGTAERLSAEQSMA